MGKNEKIKTKGFVSFLDRKIGILEDFISIIALIVMTVNTVIAIVLRYVLALPNVGGEEISRYLFVTVVFLGISMGIRESKHIGVTVFVNMMPLKIKKIIIFFAQIVTTGTFLYLAYLSWSYVETGFKRKQISVATGIPMSVIYAVMALGLTLSTIRSFMILWDTHIAKTHTLETESEGR